MLSYTDPLNFVTQYGYDASGNLSTITNALSQITTYDQYDAYGHVGRITEPSGLISTLGYDPRGRLLTLTRGTAANTLAYDKAGLLKTATLANGAVLSYGYDAAHRLTSISDSLGNSVTYTLDNAGNRTQEVLADAHGALAASIQTVAAQQQAAGAANPLVTEGQ